MWVQEIDTLDGQQAASRHLDRFRLGTSLHTTAPAQIQHAASFTVTPDKLQKDHGTVSTTHKNPSPWKALLFCPPPPQKRYAKFPKI